MADARLGPIGPMSRIVAPLTTLVTRIVIRCSHTVALIPLIDTGSPSTGDPQHPGTVLATPHELDGHDADGKTNENVC